MVGNAFLSTTTVMMFSFKCLLIEVLQGYSCLDIKHQVYHKNHSVWSQIPMLDLNTFYSYYAGIKLKCKKLLLSLGGKRVKNPKIPTKFFLFVFVF
jgi:hypothetical protein